MEKQEVKFDSYEKNWEKFWLFLKSVTVISCHSYLFLLFNICPEQRKYENKKSSYVWVASDWGKMFSSE